MTTLAIRPSSRKTDYRTLSVVHRCRATSAQLFADITDLVKLNHPTGQVDEDTLVCDLQNFFDAPDVDRIGNFCVWKNTRGHLIGFGQLLLAEEEDEIEGYLYFDVHPNWRSHALETEILQWSEQCLLEVGRKLKLPVKLRLRCHGEQILRQMVLEQQGFTLERRFLTMACSLHQPIPSSSLPNGFRLQQLSGEQDINAWVELFNNSFSAHWNHHSITESTVKYWLNNPHYKPELNWLAVASDGTLAAFGVGYINGEENARSGRNDGWIKLLGTGQGFHKLGLGRAMILTLMKQLQAAGMEQVKLGVDAQSLTSATRLYQSVGFQPVYTWLSYVKEQNTSPLAKEGIRKVSVAGI